MSDTKDKPDTPASVVDWANDDTLADNSLDSLPTNMGVQANAAQS